MRGVAFGANNEHGGSQTFVSGVEVMKVVVILCTILKSSNVIWHRTLCCSLCSGWGGKEKKKKRKERTLERVRDEGSPSGEQAGEGGLWAHQHPAWGPLPLHSTSATCWGFIGPAFFRKLSPLSKAMIGSPGMSLAELSRPLLPLLSQ